MTSSKFREMIVIEARKWIGTPYLHQASICGKGADCLGLIRGIWRRCIGPEPQKLPAYSPDWGEVSNTESLLDAADKWFTPIKIHKARAGDIALFRWKNTNSVRHVGVISNERCFIHAYEKAGVVETTLGSQYRKRIVVTYSFPQKSKSD